MGFYIFFIHFDITIEICGGWIWLSGNTWNTYALSMRVM